MLTRLTPYKGVDTAIRALASAGGENWQLVCFGGDDPGVPDESQRLTLLADELGVRGRLFLAGHHSDAAQLLAGCDALAVLTRDGGARTPGREGFGMAAMEAMLAGVPVIAPDDGGDVSRRVAGGAGLLVDASSPEGVAAALRDLDDPVVRERMGHVAQERSASLFQDAGTSAGRLVKILTSAAHRPGAGMASGPSVTVVSPVLNEVVMLDRLVAPLVAQLRPGDELVLVDSGSVDGTRQAIRRWSERDSRVRLVEVEPCSIGASRNHGVRAARNTVLACTDAGCEVDPDWLDHLRAAAAEPDAPGLVIGTYRVHTRPERLFEVALAAAAWPDPEELRRASLPWQMWHRTIGPTFSPHRVDTRSVSFSRAVFDAAGGFREDLLTAEDEAFGGDVRAAGVEAALLVDATVTWFQRESVALAFRQFRGYGRGGGHSRSWRLLRIDGIRAVGYAAVAVTLARGGPLTRAGAGGAVAFAVGFPTARVVRRKQSLAAVALIPAAQLVKDAGKLVGTFEAVVLGRTGPMPRRVRSKP
jgi:GT2 family glycosyltransferase